MFIIIIHGRNADCMQPWDATDIRITEKIA